MKKIKVVVLGLAMVAAMSLVGCSKKEAATTAGSPRHGHFDHLLRGLHGDHRHGHDPGLHLLPADGAVHRFRAV